MIILMVMISIKEIRKKTLVTVIFTSARVRLDKIIGLELDADDILLSHTLLKLMLRINKIIKEFK